MVHFLAMFLIVSPIIYLNYHQRVQEAKGVLEVVSMISFLILKVQDLVHPVLDQSKFIFSYWVNLHCTICAETVVGTKWIESRTIIVQSRGKVWTKLGQNRYKIGAKSGQSQDKVGT